MLRLQSLQGLILILANSLSFSPVGRTRKHAVFPLFLNSDLVGKHFQLEELEDAEKCNTDILLNNDKTVTVGSTDGPLFRSSQGIWGTSIDDSSEEKSEFEMKLSRTYVAGEQSKDATEIGEFTYSVERFYNGVVTSVGGSLVAVEGTILDVDDIFGTREVGFFNMIDTTDARVEDSVQ